MKVIRTIFNNPLRLRLNPPDSASTMRTAQPDTGEVAERLNALVLKTSKG
jgi:hypothetical protein